VSFIPAIRENTPDDPRGSFGVFSRMAERGVPAMRPMSVNRRPPAWLLACAVACALATGGCLTEYAHPPNQSSEPTGAIDDQPTGEPTAEQSAVAESITMTRTGGIAGVEDNWRLTPEDEFAEEAFELAAQREALQAEAAALDTEPVCCDFFVYEISVRYTDGEVVRAVVDDDPQAELLWELVTAVSDSRRLQPDEPMR